MKSILLVLLGCAIAVAGIQYVKTNVSQEAVPTNYNECRKNPKSKYNEVTCVMNYDMNNTNTTACLKTGGCVQDPNEGLSGCTVAFFNPNVTLPTNNLECTKIRRGRNAEDLSTVKDLGAGCELDINTSCAGNTGESKAIMDKCPEAYKKWNPGYYTCNLIYK